MVNSDRPRRERRVQINLGLARGSTLAVRLREAQRITGQPPTRIVREIVDDYLDLWLTVRRRERSLIEHAIRSVRAGEAR